MRALQNIPKERLILYFLFFASLPFCFLFFTFLSDKQELETFHHSLVELKEEAFLKEKKQAANKAVRMHFKGADHFYIDKNLETLIFLEPEIEQLQQIVQDPNFASDERLKKRLEFLTSPGNALVFSEGVVQKYPLFQETTETLVHPVEVNQKDVQKILSRVEGVSIGGNQPLPHRPQLIVLDFRLDKKKISENNEVFLLNMKLVKREFL